MTMWAKVNLRERTTSVLPSMDDGIESDPTDAYQPDQMDESEREDAYQPDQMVESEKEEEGHELSAPESEDEQTEPKSTKGGKKKPGRGNILTARRTIPIPASSEAKRKQQDAR